MRTFVAVELDAACNRKIADAVSVLEAAVGGVRWVKSGGLHVTLKFIGELPQRQLPEAIGCIRDAVKPTSPFLMKVGGLSAFPPRGSPRVIHILVHEFSGALERLQASVDDALCERLGIGREQRKFTAHVTLGRVKRGFRCPPVSELAALLPEADFGEVHAEEVVLMKSELTPQGAVYTALERFALEG